MYDHCSCSNYSSVLVLFSLTFRAKLPFSHVCYLVAVMVICSLMTGLTLISTLFILGGAAIKVLAASVFFCLHFLLMQTISHATSRSMARL